MKNLKSTVIIFIVGMIIISIGVSLKINHINNNLVFRIAIFLGLIIELFSIINFVRIIFKRPIK